jgi:hypothetical protein
MLAPRLKRVMGAARVKLTPKKECCTAKQCTIRFLCKQNGKIRELPARGECHFTASISIGSWDRTDTRQESRNDKDTYVRF